MLSRYDYLVIAFYFVFILSMGWIFKRFIKDTSDYFRSGGEMLWWIVGAGAFMTNFSALSFVAHASKAYLDGPVVLVIFFGNAFAFLFNYWYFAPVFRQMRCVTAMDAVRRRFGRGNEQFFTWLQIPLGILQAALWLYGLAIFLHAAFGFDLPKTIIITGVIVLVMTLLGGSWSTTASDFVQMLLLMPVTVVAAVFALAHVGGVGAFVRKAPPSFWHWGETANSKLLVFWVVAVLIQRWVTINNMTDASRYLSVKDGRHARKAALLAAILFVIGPVVWFIPPMVARVTDLNLAGMFPDVPRASETAYFAMATATLPVGMLGLLLSGIFAATMGQMDSGLNRNAGYFIKNFYQPLIRPHASERELLNVGRASTIVFGVLIILVGLWFKTLEKLTLFDIMLQLGGLVGIPIVVPLIWGMFVRRAPQWVGWSTVLVSLLTSFLSQEFLTPTWLGRVGGWTLNTREGNDWAAAIGIVLNIVVGSAWFLGVALLFPLRRRESALAVGEQPPSSLAYATPGADAEHEVDRVDRFFADMHRPIDFEREEGPGSDNLQAKVMGMLCLIYGGFITLLVLIPNAWSKRWAFLFCGAVMFGVGWLLHRASRFKESRKEAAQHGIDTEVPVSTPETNERTPA